MNGNKKASANVSGRKLDEGLYEGAIDTDLAGQGIVYFLKPEMQLRLALSVKHHPELGAATSGALARVHVNALGAVDTVELL